MAKYIAYDWNGNAYQCCKYELTNGDVLYLPWGMEEEYENYVKKHKESPSLEWAEEVYNTEKFEWKEGFEPENLHEVAAIAQNGDQAFHVGDADLEVDIALDVALYGGCYEYSQEDTDEEYYLAMAERLDFTEDDLPDTIYESENYIFAFL